MELKIEIDGKIMEAAIKVVDDTMVVSPKIEKYEADGRGDSNCYNQIKHELHLFLQRVCKWLHLFLWWS